MTAQPLHQLACPDPASFPGMAESNRQLSIEQIDSDAFANLRIEWNDLVAASHVNCFFLTWEWLYTWWKHLADNRDLFAVAIRSNGRLEAVAPLVRRRFAISHLPRLEFLGSGTAGSDYLDFIIRAGREAECEHLFQDYLLDCRIPLRLNQIRRKDCFVATFGRAWVKQGWRANDIAINICPKIDLRGHSWDSYLATLGSEHRYNFRRKLKNLEKKFSVQFQAAESEQERVDSLRTLIDLHSRRWNQRGGSDAFFLPEHLAFHDEISALALQRRWLRLFTLRLDDRPVAALYGFRYGRIFYFYQSGFDPDYSNFSVGLITMGLAIKAAIEEGAEEYDLLHGAESYKFHWAHESRELGRVDLYPPGSFGLLCNQMDCMMLKAKQVARNVLPGSMWERIVALKHSAGKGLNAPSSRKNRRLPHITLGGR